MLQFSVEEMVGRELADVKSQLLRIMAAGVEDYAEYRELVGQYKAIARIEKYFEQLMQRAKKANADV